MSAFITLGNTANAQATITIPMSRCCSLRPMSHMVQSRSLHLNHAHDNVVASIALIVNKRVSSKFYGSHGIVVRTVHLGRSTNSATASSAVSYDQSSRAFDVMA